MAMALRQKSSINPFFGRPDLRSCATNPIISDFRQSANWNHRLLSNLKRANLQL